MRGHPETLGPRQDLDPGFARSLPIPHVFHITQALDGPVPQEPLLTLAQAARGTATILPEPLGLKN